MMIHLIDQLNSLETELQEANIRNCTKRREAELLIETESNVLGLPMKAEKRESEPPLEADRREFTTRLRLSWKLFQKAWVITERHLRPESAPDASLQWKKEC